MPDKCGGKPCIRGMHIRVSDVLEMLGEGVSMEEISRRYPRPQLNEKRKVGVDGNEILLLGIGIQPPWQLRKRRGGT